MTLSLDTAYRSFGGEVEASSTPTICRLPDSRRHQLRAIAHVPVLVMHSEDDQIVPYADAGPLSAKLLKNGTLKTYKGFPHGMPTTQADTINADLLAFIKS